MAKFSICVLGSSHTASFKNGWDSICAAYPQVEVKFYPFHGPQRSAHMFRGFSASKKNKTLSLKNPQLSQTFRSLSGTDGIVETKGVDLFLIIGGVQLWSAANKRMYSKQVCDLAHDNIVLKSNCYALLDTIREISDAKVFMNHIPFSSQREPELVARAALYPAEIATLNKRILAHKSALLLPQPHKTYDRMRRTKLKYCVGMVQRERLSKAGPETFLIDDLQHMNRAYGAIAWQEIMGMVGVEPVVNPPEIPFANGHLTVEEKREKGILGAGYKGS